MRHRLDLINVAAIVLPTPGYVVRLANPSGQAIDLIKWHDEIVGEFLSELSTRMTRSTNSIPTDEITSHRYHPAARQPRTAGAISDVYDLVQLVAGQSNAFLTMAQYVEFGVLLIGIGRWWKNRIVESGLLRAAGPTNIHSRSHPHDVHWSCARGSQGEDQEATLLICAGGLFW